MIVITGATGFIGAHLVERLLQGGQRVRLLVRPSARRHAALREPEVVWGDVQDPSAVHRAMEGADVVYHLAALARAWARDPHDFTRVNVEGTQNVCAAARDCRVERLVHVSTELVDGGQTLYQRTKRAAEQVVQDHVAGGGDAVIVRPTRVYGPGPLNPANSVTRIIALYRRGLFRLRIADGGARANYVYVADVADGLIRAAERGTKGTAYVLGGENLTLPQFLDLVSGALGRRYAVVAVPKLAARVVARACALGGLLGVEPVITPEWVNLLAQDRPMSSAKAEAELGYRPRGARDGVAATVAWLTAA